MLMIYMYIVTLRIAVVDFPVCVACVGVCAFVVFVAFGCYNVLTLLCVSLTSCRHYGGQC